MAVVRSPVPSMPTPTIPKRTLSLAAVNRGKATRGSASSRMGRPASEAPATPALFCKNSRREKPVLVITSTPSARYTASVSAPVHCGEKAIDFGNRFHSLFFYAAAQNLSRLLASGKKSRPNALPECFRIRRGRSFTNDQFGRHGKFHRVVFKSLHSLQEDARGSFPHVMQRLADGSEARIVVGRNLNVVEADYGHVFWHAEIGVSKGTNRANRGDVVEGNDRREGSPLLQQFLDNGVAEFGRSQIALQLDRQLRTDFNRQLLGYRDQTAPAIVGIRAE